MIVPLLRVSKKMTAKIRISVIICLLADGQYIKITSFEFRCQKLKHDKDIIDLLLDLFIDGGG